jgi:hypothetical protein
MSEDIGVIVLGGWRCSVSGAEEAAEFLIDFLGDFPVVTVLGDEGVAQDVLHLHAFVGILLADAEDEVLDVVGDIDVLRELDLVLDLGH